LTLDELVSVIKKTGILKTSHACLIFETPDDQPPSVGTIERCIIAAARVLGTGDPLASPQVPTKVWNHSSSCTRRGAAHAFFLVAVY
jgi:hypothetical protein